MHTEAADMLLSSTKTASSPESNCKRSIGERVVTDSTSPG
jgi:hypothetical protein